MIEFAQRKKSESEAELYRVKHENIQLKEFIAKYEPKEHWETLNEYCDNLKNELDRVKRERDAAVEALTEICKDSPDACHICKHMPCDGKYGRCIGWEWRGVKEATE